MKNHTLDRIRIYKWANRLRLFGACLNLLRLDMAANGYVLAKNEQKYWLALLLFVPAYNLLIHMIWKTSDELCKHIALKVPLRDNPPAP